MTALTAKVLINEITKNHGKEKPRVLKYSSFVTLHKSLVVTSLRSRNELGFHHLFSRILLYFRGFRDAAKKLENKGYIFANC